MFGPLPSFYRLKYNSTLGNYRFHEIFYEGDFGSVFKGVDITNHTNVAIKKLNMGVYDPAGTQPDSPPTLPEKVRDEIQLQEKLRHTNIVLLLKVIQEDSRQVSFIYEYRGLTLAQYLHRLYTDFSMDLRLIKSYLYQIATALSYCKRKFVVHRDVNPANLVISTDGLIKLANFSGSTISVNIPRPSRPSVCIFPTKWYRPPEILLGYHPYSYPVDIWSLGCVFAEMITRQVLFDDKTTQIESIAIFKVLSSPTEETWPGVSSLTHYSSLPKFHKTCYCLPKKVPQLDESGLHLLWCMLICDPKNRITAAKILEHPFLSDVIMKPIFAFWC